MADVKFLNPQGEEITRDIRSAEQISGFEKSGFKALSNPFSSETTTQPTIDQFMTGQQQKRELTSKPPEPVVKPPVQTDTEKLQQEAQQGEADYRKTLENEIVTTQARFDALNEATKKQNENLINSIKATYANRISQMELINKGATGAVTTAQLRSGRARYAPELATGAISAEERAGIQRISELDAEMNSLINQAQMAATDKEFERLNSQMSKISELRSQQRESLQNQLKMAQDFEDRAIKKSQDALAMQKTQQEILETNLDLYSSALLGYDEEGNITTADEDQINAYAEQLGVPPELVKSRMNKQISELSKLSQEDRLREKQILKAQQDLIPQFAQEYEYAKNNFGYAGTWQQFIADKQVASSKAETTMPKIVKINGEDYVQNTDGSFSKPTLPQIESQQKLQQARDTIVSIDELLADENLGKAVGPISANVPMQLRTGDRNAVDAKIDSLIAKLALENLSLLKGPMSDRDIQFIKEASSALKKNVSEEAFKEELLKIKDKFVEAQNDVNYFGANASELKKMEFDMYAKELRDTYPNITPEEAFGLWREKNGGPKYEMGGDSPEVSQKIVSSFKPGTFGGQCGEFTHKIVDFPPMGDMYSEKVASVDKFGVRKENWTPKVGDVVISDASDVSRTGKPLQYGHAAVVAEIKPNGELVLIESNRRGDERITIGRTISKDNPAIYGALRGTIKQKYLS